MAFNAKVYQVMIASPGDVIKERELVKEIIYEWNAIYSLDKEVILLPVGWETHSSPEMGDRAQAIINNQVLKKCDLLVAVFWTRIGTPTGVSTSGTVEEIEEHIAKGKPAMIYFSSAPVRPDSIDQEQYGQLLTFKKEYMQKGLVEIYDSLPEFIDKFRRQISIKLINHEYFNTIENEFNTSGYQIQSLPNKTKYNLNKEERELLIDAASSGDGSIIKLDTVDGIYMQVNGKQLIDERNIRSEAIWEDALKTLLSYNLIKERGLKGNVFVVTRQGYEVVDYINRQL